MLNFMEMTGHDVFDWEGSEEYHEAVIREYGKKLMKRPKSYVFVSMANSCLKAGKTKMAMEVLEKGMKHHPNLLSAHICKARIFIESEQLDDAEKILQRVIAKKPENLLARKLMAFIHLKKDEPEEGLKQLDAVRELEPNHNVPQVLHKKLLAEMGLASAGKPDGISESQQLVLNTLDEWLATAKKMKEKISA